jgi:hypothetical protein
MCWRRIRTAMLWLCVLAEASGGETRLRIEPAVLEFAAVPVGGVDRKEVTVTNRGETGLVIARINSTCGCAEPEFGAASARSAKSYLEAGESTTVTIQVRPKKAGRQSGSIFFYVTGEAQPAGSVGVSVPARAGVPLQPAELDIGDVEEGESKSATVELRTAGGSPLEVMRWRVDPRQFEVQWEPGTPRGRLTVKLLETAVPGVLEESAICELAGEGEPVGAVQLNGRVLARYVAEPTELSLVRQGSEAGPPRVVIRDRRGEAVEITQAACSLAGVEATGRTLEQGTAEVVLADRRSQPSTNLLRQVERLEITIAGWSRPVVVPLVVQDVYTGRRLEESSPEPVPP